jgi:hypothetical protein
MGGCPGDRVYCSEQFSRKFNGLQGLLVGPPLPIAVEHGVEQPFLAAERGIKAGRIDLHRPGQFSERGPFVALAPEHLYRPMTPAHRYQTCSGGHRSSEFPVTH